jgi:DNA-binding transcriptional MerR regulator
MRLAELSQRADVPRSTIKFYIRERLLKPGAPHARNQASYGSQHLERLELIRALREVAGLPLEAVARVTAQLDRGWEGDPIGEAMRAMYLPASHSSAQASKAELERLSAEVKEFLLALPWTTDEHYDHNAEEIAAAILQVRRYLYPDFAVADLAKYAEIAWLLSEAEFTGAPEGPGVPIRARGDDIAEPTRRAILGTVLFERIFASLRRCANTMRSIRISTGAKIPPARLSLPRRSHSKRSHPTPRKRKRR